MDKRAVEGVKDFLKEVKEEYKIEKTFLFGSRAGEDYLEESDIDILLVSDDFKGMRFPSRSAEMLRFWDFDYGDPEFLCYTVEEFEKKKSKLTIVQDAVMKGVSVKV